MAEDALMFVLNAVSVIARLTRDPEVKYIPSGQAVARLGLAINNRYQDKSGEWKDDPVFIDAEAWGKLAERCAETMKKGQPVLVQGKLKMEQWEKDGAKISKIKIAADSVKAENKGRDDEEGDSKPRQSTGRPSDNLNFDHTPTGTTKDDIPF
jgi:single-strand DNA-binding protein